VISPGTAYLLTDILSDDVARIPAFGEGSLLELPFPAAVKTGTTTDWRDNWTIGYSTERLVGVWVGNADNTPMLDVSGIDGAGPIWHDLMLAAHPRPPGPFPRPNDIVEVTICAPSGLLPTPACPRTRHELFLRGSEPTQVDNQFRTLTVDQATGLLATPDTPAARTAQRTFWLLPPEYHDWMVGQGIPIAQCGVGSIACGGQDMGCRLGSGNCPAISAANPTERVPINEQQAAERPGPDIRLSALVLSAPTSNTAYQIHPGLPQANQRLEVAGYVADGQPWAVLRLMMDGQALAEASGANRLNSWWTLTIGEHHFWLEGKMTDKGELIRSPTALVVVDHFQSQTVADQATQ